MGAPPPGLEGREGRGRGGGLNEQGKLRTYTRGQSGKRVKGLLEVAALAGSSAILHTFRGYAAVVKGRPLAVSP